METVVAESISTDSSLHFLFSLCFLAYSGRAFFISGTAFSTTSFILPNASLSDASIRNVMACSVTDFLNRNQPSLNSILIGVTVPGSFYIDSSVTAFYGNRVSFHV